MLDRRFRCIVTSDTSLLTYPLPYSPFSCIVQLYTHAPQRVGVDPDCCEALGSDTVTSQLWEAVISSIANVKLPVSSVAPLRDISIGLAAAKPPSLVAVGGMFFVLN